MINQIRNYTHPDDYYLVSQFLVANHLPGNLDRNWLEPAWEYMHFHPMLESEFLDKIRIWINSEEIVGVAHYEWRLGEAFFQFHPAFSHLRGEMLDYAETALVQDSPEDGSKILHAYVNDTDPEFQELVKERGYRVDPESARPLYSLDIHDPFLAVTLPDDFRLTSLAEEPDWGKVHRVMWRGFNHAGEPPVADDELEGRLKMFDTPKARRDLKIAVAAPNRDFVAFCGMFYEPENRYAYVEPVATDPGYRRLGLGKAAVLEGIRRCAGLGAKTAYVGSDQEFYKALGFRKVFDSECWVKKW
jgi:GNAT superfamily N-acetyltransferase